MTAVQIQMLSWPEATGEMIENLQILFLLETAPGGSLKMSARCNDQPSYEVVVERCRDPAELFRIVKRDWL